MNENKVPVTAKRRNAKSRSDRYIGYMAETLETLYFMKNAEKFGGKLNIVHTKTQLKHFNVLLLQVIDHNTTKGKYLKNLIRF